jgi:peptide-methionine (R)-S-oxide reductase
MQYGKSQEAIDRLTAEQRRVTQEAGTERPFTGEYNDRTERLRSMAGCVEDLIE